MDDKIKELVGALILKTAEGRISWEKTSRASEFIYKAEHGAITVDNYVVHDEEYGEEIGNVVDIIVLNAKGERVDRYAFGEDEAVDYRFLNKLHTLVVRKVNKVDEIIDQFIFDISKK